MRPAGVPHFSPPLRETGFAAESTTPYVGTAALGSSVEQSSTAFLQRCHSSTFGGGPQAPDIRSSN